LGADAGARVQEPLRICLECMSKSIKHDKQLTRVVRVGFSLQFLNPNDRNLNRLLFGDL